MGETNDRKSHHTKFVRKHIITDLFAGGFVTLLSKTNSSLLKSGLVITYLIHEIIRLADQDRKGQSRSGQNILNVLTGIL